MNFRGDRFWWFLRHRSGVFLLAIFRFYLLFSYSKHSRFGSCFLVQDFISNVLIDELMISLSSLHSCSGTTGLISKSCVFLKLEICCVNLQFRNWWEITLILDYDLEIGVLFWSNGLLDVDGLVFYFSWIVGGLELLVWWYLIVIFGFLVSRWISVHLPSVSMELFWSLNSSLVVNLGCWVFLDLL